jgi:hypothetical protein
MDDGAATGSVTLISAWPDLWHTVDLSVWMQAFGFVAAALGAAAIAAPAATAANNGVM